MVEGDGEWVNVVEMGGGGGEEWIGGRKGTYGEY